MKPLLDFRKLCGTQRINKFDHLCFRCYRHPIFWALCLFLYTVNEGTSVTSLRARQGSFVIQSFWVVLLPPSPRNQCSFLFSGALGKRSWEHTKEAGCSHFGRPGQTLCLWQWVLAAGFAAGWSYHVGWFYRSGGCCRQSVGAGGQLRSGRWLGLLSELTECSDCAWALEFHRSFSKDFWETAGAGLAAFRHHDRPRFVWIMVCHHLGTSLLFRSTAPQLVHHHSCRTEWNTSMFLPLYSCQHPSKQKVQGASSEDPARKLRVDVGISQKTMARLESPSGWSRLGHSSNKLWLVVMSEYDHFLEDIPQYWLAKTVPFLCPHLVLQLSSFIWLYVLPAEDLCLTVPKPPRCCIGPGWPNRREDFINRRSSPSPTETLLTEEFAVALGGGVSFQALPQVESLSPGGTRDGLKWLRESIVQKQLPCL